jgi:hypothetical protein
LAFSLGFARPLLDLSFHHRVISANYGLRRAHFFMDKIPTHWSDLG